jgi:hypothetical protein
MSHELRVTNHESLLFLDVVFNAMKSLVQQVPSSEFHKVVTSQLITDLQNQSDQLDNDAVKCLATWQTLVKYYSEDPALITSKDFLGSICLFLHHFKNCQVQHLPKSPQTSYDIHTTEMMECMRQGELAEIRRTLRRNNGPTGSTWRADVDGGGGDNPAILKQSTYGNKLRRKKMFVVLFRP